MKVVIICFAALAQAACPRPLLQSTLDKLSASMMKPSPPDFKLAKPVRILENNKPKVDLSKTVLATTTGLIKPFNVSVLDEGSCNIALLNMPQTGGNTTNLLSTRIHITPAGQVDEVELHNGQFVIAPGVPSDPGPAWHIKSPASREALFKVLNSYPEGVQRGDGAAVPVDRKCQRFENGIPMPVSCNGMFWVFKADTPGRRWYIDTKTGIALGNFAFAYEKQFGGLMPTLWLHEYMKVQDGKIMGIHAVMTYMYGWTDKWSPPTVTRR